MKKALMIISCCLLILLGCSDVFALKLNMGTGPKSESEAFPQRNQDPRLGVIVNRGTAHLNIYIYDEAGRLIEQNYMAGANRWLTINGRHMERYWVRRLAVGRYRVEIYPFYYQTNLFPPERYRVDLPRQVLNMRVNRNPTDVWFAGRHWGWTFFINGGYIPDTAHGLPGVKVNAWGDF